jgi:hypothetical protein
MVNQDIFKIKYLKYKNKYMNLKNLAGGMEKLAADEVITTSVPVSTDEVIIPPVPVPVSGSTDEVIIPPVPVPVPGSTDEVIIPHVPVPDSTEEEIVNSIAPDESKTQPQPQPQPQPNFNELIVEKVIEPKGEDNLNKTETDAPNSLSAVSSEQPGAEAGAGQEPSFTGGKRLRDFLQPRYY